MARITNEVQFNDNLSKLNLVINAFDNLITKCKIAPKDLIKLCGLTVDPTTEYGRGLELEGGERLATHLERILGGEETLIASFKETFKTGMDVIMAYKVADLILDKIESQTKYSIFNELLGLINSKSTYDDFHIIKTSYKFMLSKGLPKEEAIKIANTLELYKEWYPAVIDYNLEPALMIEKNEFVKILTMSLAYLIKKYGDDFDRKDLGQLETSLVSDGFEFFKDINGKFGSPFSLSGLLHRSQDKSLISISYLMGKLLPLSGDGEFKGFATDIQALVHSRKIARALQKKYCEINPKDTKQIIKAFNKVLTSSNYAYALDEKLIQDWTKELGGLFCLVDKFYHKKNQATDYHVRMCILGDSVTAGLGILDPDKRIDRVFDRKLEAMDYKVGPNLENLKFQVINSSVSGHTMKHGAERIDALMDIYGKDLDLLVIELGGNDLIFKSTLPQTLKSIGKIAKACFDKGIVLYLVNGIPNSFQKSSARVRDREIASYDGIIEYLLENFEGKVPYNGKTYPIIYKRVGPEVYDDPKNMQKDKIHYNEEGLDKLAQFSVDNFGPLMKDIANRKLSVAPVMLSGADRADLSADVPSSFVTDPDLATVVLDEEVRIARMG